jgi:hypothetical protein
MTRSHSFWTLLAIILLTLGTIVGFTVQSHNREADRRVAKEACAQVNELRKGTVKMARTIRDDVDLLQTPDDRARIVEGYNRALMLLDKADCTP